MNDVVGFCKSFARWPMIDDMAKWARPRFSRTRVNRAGEDLLKARHQVLASDDYLEVIDNWRSAHGYPLHAISQNVRNWAPDGAIVATRLKRLPSIELKLSANPHMKLSQMQDIGGCRAVVRSMNQLRELISRFQNPRIHHELCEVYDYITEPKADGYRGAHLVYKYRSRDPRNSDWNRLRVEVQLRTKLQHVWATAVETVSLFTGQALKSNIGEDSWKEFFKLMGTAIAARERAPLVPGSPQGPELIARLQGLVSQYGFDTAIEGWTAATEHIVRSASKKTQVFLLVLNTTQKQLIVEPYFDRRTASADYIQRERASSNRDDVQVCLVAVNSIQALPSAYPNFYLDMGAFMKELNRALRGNGD